MHTPHEASAPFISRFYTNWFVIINKSLINNFIHPSELLFDHNVVKKYFAGRLNTIHRNICHFAITVIVHRRGINIQTRLNIRRDPRSISLHWRHRSSGRLRYCGGRSWGIYTYLLLVTLAVYGWPPADQQSQWKLNVFESGTHHSSWAKRIWKWNAPVESNWTFLKVERTGRAVCVWGSVWSRVVRSVRRRHHDHGLDDGGGAQVLRAHRQRRHAALHHLRFHHLWKRSDIYFWYSRGNYG